MPDCMKRRFPVAICGSRFVLGNFTRCAAVLLRMLYLRRLGGLEQQAVDMHFLAPPQQNRPPRLLDTWEKQTAGYAAFRYIS